MAFKRQTRVAGTAATVAGAREYPAMPSVPKSIEKFPGLAEHLKNMAAIHEATRKNLAELEKQVAKK